MNIFEKLFIDEDFDAVNNIVRWNGMRRIKDETVSQHSFIVSVFVRYFLETIFFKSNENTIDFSYKVLTSCIFHDLDENFIGDIDHRVKHNKYNSAILNVALDEIISRSAKEKFSGIDNLDVRNLFKNGISYYNEETIKDVVKIGEWLSCLFYVFKERKMGNKLFKAEYTLCEAKLLEAIDKADKSLELQFTSNYRDRSVSDIKNLINTLRSEL